MGSHFPEDRRPLLSHIQDWTTYQAQQRDPDAHTLNRSDREAQVNDNTEPTDYQRLPRILAAYFSFIVVGAYDGSYGPLNAPLRTYYSLSYLTVSFALLSPVLGYILAALLNDLIHTRYGQRGIAVLTSCFHIFAAVIASQRPPYPLFVLACLLAGLGNGIADASWNAWIGAMEKSNGPMGLLHGFYGVGAALSPLGVTAVVNRAGLEWHCFYYIMLAAAALEFCTSVPAFWKEDGARHREKNQRVSNQDQDEPTLGNGQRHEAKERSSVLLEALRAPTTWLVCIFVFLYAGTEIGLADWVASFLIDARGISPDVASLITFGYWVGLTLGRTVVGFVASAFAPGKATVYICLALTTAAWVAFVLCKELAESAITVVIFGFFLGPLFPEAVVLQAKLLPAKLHLAAIGFVCAFGSAGGGVFPFLIGTLANELGIQALLPFIFVTLFGSLVCWWSLRRL